MTPAANHEDIPPLPASLQDEFIRVQPRILRRLDEFARVPREDYFYECCFCICTPQTKASAALVVQQMLQEKDFLNTPFDPVEILLNAPGYIRFHNVKAKRLLMLRQQWPRVESILLGSETTAIKRRLLVETVQGYGLKEASHLLRNTGGRGLSILDRHVLRCLLEIGVYDAIPSVATARAYESVEQLFFRCARRWGIDPDELDMFFWYLRAGDILK